MSYVLENPQEADRLERQSRQPGYQLEQELRECQPTAGDIVLDAGCGTGLVARWLAHRFPSARIEGCDFSALRLQQARDLCSTPQEREIRYFESALEKIDAPDRTYDWLACRYVFEHLRDHAAVAHEIYRVLKPGGRAVIVNFDGVIHNLSSPSPRLAELLETLRQRFELDLFIGRKIPGILRDAGFAHAGWRIETVSFQGADLLEEQTQMRQRLQFAKPYFASALGSDALAEEFAARYCEEMVLPRNTLFYNKFVVVGLKTTHG